MEGLFKAKVDKVFEQLDYGALAEEDRKILFQGRTYDPAIHIICRLPIQIEPVRSRKTTARFRRRKGYENVTTAILWAKIESPGIRLMGMLPNSTSVEGEQDNDYSEEAVLGVNVPPVFKLELSGKAKQAFRRKQRMIIAARTSSEAQWAFEKTYLRDNLGFTLIFLFERQGETRGGLVRIKMTFLDRGRDIYSPKPKMIGMPAEREIHRRYSKNNSEY
jgi:hypothetical protein